MKNKLWDTVSNLFVALFPIFLIITVSFSAWVTTELLAARYTSLTITDGRRILVDARNYTDSKYDVLLSEINRLRKSVDKQSTTITELTVEVKLIPQWIARESVQRH